MGEYGSFFLKFTKKEESAMSKSNRYATNKGGVIKAPNSVGKDSPKSTIVKTNGDLRDGTKKSKK
jgi:hypothetical protein